MILADGGNLAVLRLSTTPIASLALWLKMTERLIGAGHPFASKARLGVFICPVDVGTDAVTRLAKEAADLRTWNAGAEARFRAHADQASLDPLDRAKIHALWGSTALRLRARASAERPLRSLDGHPTFGKWANRKLAEVAL